MVEEDKKLIYKCKAFGSDGDLLFFEDGTYLRTSGETSWWKYEGGGDER
jgi:hypothetical protein